MRSVGNIFYIFTLDVSNPNQSVVWYACEASLGKERYVKLNEWKIRRSVC